GDIGAKTAEEMMEIFETMSTNSSQKSSRGKKAMVHEIAPGQDMIAHQIAELTEQMRLLNARSVQSVQAMTIESCGTCGVHGHRSEVCPSTFDQEFGEPHIDANALQGYQNQPVNDPYSNTYNPGWRNHLNFSWSNNNNTQQPRQNFMQQPNWPNFAPQQHMRPNFPQQQQPQRGPMGGMQNQGAGPSSATQDGKLDKILQFMTNQESTIKRMETQIGQLTSRVGNLEAGPDKGKLPSQPEQAKAITVLRSGKVVNNQVEMPETEDPKPTDEPKDDDVEDSTQTNSKKLVGGPFLHKSTNPFKPRIPFPGRLRDEIQEKQFRDLYNMLSKVNVNLPLLDVIKNMPSYVKFFKDLVTKKRRFEDGEKVVVYEAASTMHHDLPKKE
ncbi:Unknown protein, partial [Striga hermonthica]